MLDCSDILPPDSSSPEWQGQMLTAMGESDFPAPCMILPTPASTCTGQEPAALSAQATSQPASATTDLLQKQLVRKPWKGCAAAQVGPCR